MIKPVLCTGATIGVLALASTASAGLLSYSGQVALVGETLTPFSFEYGQMVSNEHASLFIESSGHTLENDLLADIPGESGVYHRFNRPAEPTVIPSGTTIDSYFIHQDLVGNDPNFGVMMEFTLTFDEPILGLIVGGDWVDGSLFGTTLDDSDFLGGVEYTTNEDQRRRGALEGSAAERLTISEDGRTLTGSLYSIGVHVDNVRVITMQSVPTPGSAALLGLTGAMVWRRRRS